MTRSWTLYVVWHKTLVDSHYTPDSSFDHAQYVFVKANPAYAPSYNPHFGYRIVYEHVLPVYDASLQDKTYMMPAVIYNLYKSGAHQEPNYIGFMEYDIPLKDGTTQRINDIIQANSRCVIPLSYRNSFQRLCQQSIFLRGRQCMLGILDDFNAYFGTQHAVKTLWEANPTLTTQQSFLADRETFCELGRFLEHVIDNKLAEQDPDKPQDTWHRPSTLLDRYIGLALHLLAPVIEPEPLDHISMQLWSDK